MNKPIAVFKETSGLNNLVDPARIKHDLSTGATELAEAYNIDIDNSGNISRRKGLTATAVTENAHSMFCEGGDCLFVSGTTLYKLNPDYSKTVIRSDMVSGAKCNYCQIANRIYYMNGFQKGYTTNGIDYSWEAASYVGPTTYKQFSDPPLGSKLVLHSSRIYVVVDNILWYSEPLAYGWFDLASNFIPFRSNIRMIRAVKDGIFVGTETEVVFLGGTDPREFYYLVVSTSVVVDGTDVKVLGTDVGNGEQADVMALWTAQDGIYLGGISGKVINLTVNKLTYPASQLGCAVVNGSKYITLLQ